MKKSNKVNAAVETVETVEQAATSATETLETVAAATQGEEQSSLMLESLQSYFEAYPNASLRKLAHATEVNYGILLKKSKEPIPGEAYDPEAVNWGAIEAKLTAKKVDWTKLDWDALNAGPNRKGATLQKDIKQFKVGDKVYLRRNNETPYEILYMTETHVVIMLEGSTEPQAWANNTFLINGPVYEPRTEKKTSARLEMEATGLGDEEHEGLHMDLSAEEEAKSMEEAEAVLAMLNAKGSALKMVAEEA